MSTDLSAQKKFSHAVNRTASRLGDWSFRNAKLVLGLILLATVGFAFLLPQVKLWSNFDDLLPQNHPYVELHNEVRETYGGANVIILNVAVDEGTIFTNETLQMINRLTLGVDVLPSVNHDLLESLTHRNKRKVFSDATGAIRSRPYFDPNKPTLSDSELEALKNDILANPQIYGVLVSPDLKSALIKATLNEGGLDYSATFVELQKLLDAEKQEGVTVYAAGQPVLIGWVYSYLPQVFQIFALTMVIMIVLLIIYFRKFYGIMVPLVAITVSSIWGVAIVVLLDYNLDPLTLVIPFLVSARSLSHAIQFTERYYQELVIENGNGFQAARNTIDSMFRPGTLGVVVDALGLLLIGLAGIPIHTKLAIYCFLWAMQSIITVIVFVPVLLAVLPAPKDPIIKHSGLSIALPWAAKMAIRGRGAMIVLVVTAVVTALCAFLAGRVQVGEVEAGSPLLFPDHNYNVSSRVINESFPGSEEMFVIVRTEEKEGIKQPEVLHALIDFQNFMLLDPDTGGTKGVTGMVRNLNRTLRNEDQRFANIPRYANEAGGLMIIYMTTSPIPGALREYVNSEGNEANIVFYFKDHTGKTIRRAIDRAEKWIASPAATSVEGLSVHLAAGIVGVIAATDEEVYRSNLLITPMVLLMIFVVVSLSYWTLKSGLMMFVPMLFAVLFTKAYMGAAEIGLNVSTIPIIAVGLGIGIDYSIYVMDRLREEMAHLNDIDAAIEKMLNTTGMAVSFTGTTLIGGIVLFIFMSDLRFQADSALLLSVMILANLFAALFVVPAWCKVFKPEFVMLAAELTGSGDEPSGAGARAAAKA